MRAVIQRVDNASVHIDGVLKSSIGRGLMVLLGVEENDAMDDVQWLAAKIIQMRIFADEDDKMNLSLLDAGGEMLVVSQFTLHAMTKKGNRPSFIRAARPEQAIPLYEAFVRECEQLLQKKVQTGEFGAMMDVSLVNSGPVTIIMDTKMKE